jgi:pimeloyl-ACP methyl ester carboxylesterase
MRDRLDRGALLPSLDLPALVIVGREDELTPPASARAMAAALGNSTLVEVPFAGHTPCMERPIPTAEAILAFLRKHFPGPAAPVPIRARVPR